jgi:hypothetical protein
MNQVSTDGDLAGHADRTLASVGIDDTHLDQRRGAPGVPHPSAAVRVQDGEPGDLGLTEPARLGAPERRVRR